LLASQDKIVAGPTPPLLDLGDQVPVDMDVAGESGLGHAAGVSPCSQGGAESIQRRYLRVELSRWHRGSLPEATVLLACDLVTMTILAATGATATTIVVAASAAPGQL
jgi:hypothetical protein